MFLGHFGVAFAAKRVAPRLSLGTAVLAVQWADLVWPFFVLLGIERVAIRPGVTVVTPLEFVLFVAGIALYLRATHARDRLGRILPWTFIVTLAVLYLGAVFGPPPPSVGALAATGLAGWLFVAWAYWIDRHRVLAAAI
jgi:hypothetical protein